MDDCADTFESGREIGGGDVRNFDDFKLGIFLKSGLEQRDFAASCGSEDGVRVISGPASNNLYPLTE
jgi:hypothetical protein